MVIHWEHHKIEDTYISNKAIVGGKHDTLDKIYVAKTKHIDYYLPAKYILDLQLCFTSFDGKEIPVEEFDVLVGDSHKYSWEPASFGVRKNSSRI
jgi:hypothetical protein